jgi:uncharacterized protein YjiS (DUF1127 family)
MWVAIADHFSRLPPSMLRSCPKHRVLVQDDSGVMTIEALRTVQIKFIASVAAVAHDVWCSLGARFQNARTRRQLARLDARELRDIGLTEAHRQAECRKSFWV